MLSYLIISIQLTCEIIIISFTKTLFVIELLKIALDLCRCLLIQKAACSLVEKNAMVGLSFMWLTAQHALTQAAGVAFSLNVLKPLCSSEHKMSQRLQWVPGARMTRLSSTACFKC